MSPKLHLPFMLLTAFILTLLFSYTALYLNPPPEMLKGEIPQVLQGTDIALPGVGSAASETIAESYALTTIVPWVIKFLLQLASVLAVVGVILGGWFYIASFGDEAGMTKGKNAVMYAIFGLVIALLSYAIVDVVSSIDW